jgi:hypothetical protein
LNEITRPVVDGTLAEVTTYFAIVRLNQIVLVYLKPTYSLSTVRNQDSNIGSSIEKERRNLVGLQHYSGLELHWTGSTSNRLSLSFVSQATSSTLRPPYTTSTSTVIQQQSIQTTTKRSVFFLDKVSIRLAAASNVVYLIVQKEALPTTIPYIPHTNTSHTQPDSCFSALTPEPGTLEVLPFHPKAATSQPQIGQSTFI